MEPTPTWIIGQAVQFVTDHYATLLVDLPIHPTAVVENAMPTGWIVTVTLVPHSIIVRVLVQADGHVDLAD